MTCIRFGMPLIEDLWRDIQRSGRECDARALFRLVSYWSFRTPLSMADVADCIRQDIRHGWPIGMRKRGWN